MHKIQLEKDLKKAIIQLGFQIEAVSITIPEQSQFGDYMTNSPLQLAKQKVGGSYQNPQEIASKIVEGLGKPEYLERIEIAGPGFINFFLNNTSLVENVL